METRNQKGWVGHGPVISVRVEPELVERLDALAARTNRSRGAYLRMALWAALPSLERMHWEQVAADFEELAIKDAFEEITLGLMEDALKNDRNTRHNNRGDSAAPIPEEETHMAKCEDLFKEPGHLFKKPVAVCINDR